MNSSTSIIGSGTSVDACQVPLPVVYRLAVCGTVALVIDVLLILLLVVVGIVYFKHRRDRNGCFPDNVSGKYTSNTSQVEVSTNTLSELPNGTCESDNHTPLPGSSSGTTSQNTSAKLYNKSPSSKRAPRRPKPAQTEPSVERVVASSRLNSSNIQDDKDSDRSTIRSQILARYTLYPVSDDDDDDEPVYGSRYNPSEPARRSRPVDAVQVPQMFAPGKEQKGSIRVTKVVLCNNQHNNEQDVFIYYHDNELRWVLEVLIPNLEKKFGLKIQCKDDFPLGSAWVDEVLANIRASEFVLLVLSDDFIADGTCRVVTTIAFSINPHAIVPVSIKLKNLSGLMADDLFWGILQTNSLIPWSDNPVEQDMFWTLLEIRLVRKPAKISELDLLKAIASRQDLQIQELRQNIEELRGGKRKEPVVDVLMPPETSLLLHHLMKTRGGTDVALTSGDVISDDNGHVRTRCQAYVARVCTTKHISRRLRDFFISPEVLQCQHRTIAYSIGTPPEDNSVDDGELYNIGRLVLDFLHKNSWKDIFVAVACDTDRRIPDKSKKDGLPTFVQAAILDSMKKLNAHKELVPKPSDAGQPAIKELESASLRPIPIE